MTIARGRGPKSDVIPGVLKLVGRKYSQRLVPSVFRVTISSLAAREAAEGDENMTNAHEIAATGTNLLLGDYTKRDLDAWMDTALTVYGADWRRIVCPVFNRVYAARVAMMGRRS